MHAYAHKDGDLAANSFVASALVDMYTNQERLAKARRVFDMVPESGQQLGLWNAMIYNSFPIVCFHFCCSGSLFLVRSIFASDLVVF